VSPPPPPPPSATIHGTGWVYGTAGNNSIIGDSGHDSLVGQGGNDTFSGGTYVQGLGGNDVIYVANAATFINEPNANNATVMSSVSFSLYDGSYNNVHKLTLTGSASTATGTWGNDVLVGNVWNNALNGKGGNDTLTGGAGNDTITAAAGSSSVAVYTDTYASHHFSGTAYKLTVTGTDGTDLLNNITTLQFSDTTITTAQALAGVSPPPPPPPPPPPTGIHGTGWVNGTTGNDSIHGDSGHDSLVGKGGNDTFSGGTYVEGSGGSDVIYVTNSTTFIDEPNPNNAQVMSSVSFSLFDGSYNNVHKLTLTGSGNLTATGTWGGDTLTGNAGNSTLNGLSGADTMVGGSGHDMFRFDSLSSQNSVVKAFVHGQDVIDLHGVLAQVGSTGDPIANHALTLTQSGADTKVLIDDHTGAPKLLVTLQGITASTLNPNDFHY
jgi:Ca2+-binding RTX toxin-like protein